MSNLHFLKTLCEADVCRELGIRLVDSLGEKVQSSPGNLVHDHACPYGVVLVDVGDFPTIDVREILDMYER